MSLASMTLICLPSSRLAPDLDKNRKERIIKRSQESYSNLVFRPDRKPRKPQQNTPNQNPKPKTPRSLVSPSPKHCHWCQSPMHPLFFITTTDSNE
ncbi:hypothetical protein N657DRAFT_138921 [Parathielavia appendiculata]|uniref:Uncharacterized protein n=1 Tax=Parathielavia appendiculata TaxID=2587402 RepID=A0AAN6Z0R5_9PEZI|nr:hypothetical protein N657DRAFT_138921 [Parathielavia appendiculata]